MFAPAQNNHERGHQRVTLGLMSIGFTMFGTFMGMAIGEYTAPGPDNLGTNALIGAATGLAISSLLWLHHCYNNRNNDDQTPSAPIATQESGSTYVELAKQAP